MPEKKRLYSLDVIRFASFLLVLIFYILIHVKEADGISYKIPGFLDYIGVSFFIVLSGVSLGLNNKETKVLSFYKKRYLAIYPSYWVSYLAVAIFFFLFKSSLIIGKESIWTLLGLDGFLLSKFQTKYLIGEWYTGFILLVYLIAPFIIRFIKRKGCLALAVCLLVSGVSYFLIRKFNLGNKFIFIHNNVIWNPTVRLFEFAFGVYLSFILNDNKKNFRVFLICVLVLIASLTVKKLLNVNAVFMYCPIFVSIFFIVFYALNKIEYNETLMMPVMFFAKYSFGAFLVHHFIILQVLDVLKTAFSEYPLKPALLSLFITVFTFSYVAAYLLNKPAMFLKSYILNVLDICKIQITKITTRGNEND